MMNWDRKRCCSPTALAADTSANWQVTFGANNGLDDKEVVFGFTAASDSVPRRKWIQHRAQLTVNKDEATAGGAAGSMSIPSARASAGIMPCA